MRGANSTLNGDSSSRLTFKNIIKMEKIEEIIKLFASLTFMEVIVLIQTIKNRFNVEIPITNIMENILKLKQKCLLSNDKFTVVLKGIASDKKLLTVKAIKEVCNYGLREAKDIVDTCPSDVIVNIPMSQAFLIKNEIEKVNGIVEIIPTEKMLVLRKHIDKENVTIIQEYSSFTN